ncbi:MAG: hypothetical protein IJ744_02610 [Lachnospiraceae bacterium]|nr:hypothetical protein [Lachnospiraceae bacterium]
MDATDFEWIDGTKDDPEDLCLHGLTVARIGERTLEFASTVSATALYLLKTITEDHIMNEYGIQMMPCCGHFMIPDNDLQNVEIEGCCYGVDWSVIHEGDAVKIILEDGYEETVALEDYIPEVYRFADKIEAFYLSCTPKILPEDEFGRDGYIAFWNEWHRRRGNAR